MNRDAKMLGLELYFTHPSGLDENGKIGGKGSALSVAKLFAYARKSFPEILDATTKTRVSVTSSTGKISGIPNTNQRVYNLTGLEASKTGFTDMAGANLAVVVDVGIGHPVAIVVLGSTHDERFSDVEKLQKALQKSVIR
jgi:D-alanyl-D-alanine carboxypeptidase